MVSILLGVWNGGGVCCCCPAHCSGAARALLISTAVMSRTVPCQMLWCVGVGVCVVFVWWGILCALPPRRGGGWGHRGWWGAVVVVGGMVSEGRLCCWAPRRVSVSPVCVLASPLLFTLWPY